MSKQSGLGDHLYIDGVDLSGDVGSIGSMHGGPTGTQDVTGINKFAYERLGLLLDGELDHSGFFNPAAGAAHPTLKTLPYTDRILSYFHGGALGNEACGIVAKQLNYDWTRGADGSLTTTTNAQANGYGIEWGQQLTPGQRTDTTATNGTGVDLTYGVGTFPPIFPATAGASVSFGWSAYVHVFAFTGTSIVFTVQDSADNSTFTTLTGGAFPSVTTGPGAMRIAGANTATVRRYARVATTGTFTSCTFALVFVPYLVGGHP